MIEPSNAEQATWSYATRNYVHDLAAENERLRALVETGYCEGWDDGAFSNSPDQKIDWLNSTTRAALQPKEGE